MLNILWWKLPHEVWRIIIIKNHLFAEESNLPKIKWFSKGKKWQIRTWNYHSLLSYKKSFLNQTQDQNTITSQKCSKWMYIHIIYIGLLSPFISSCVKIPCSCVDKLLSYFHALLLNQLHFTQRGSSLAYFWELFLAMMRFSSRFQIMHTILPSLVPYSVLYNIQ